MKEKVAVLTETNSGIMGEEAEKKGIYVMPMPVIIEDEIFYEGQNLTEEQFYSALEEGKKISTSQPAPGDLLEKWEELLSAYEQVLYIPMSAGLSNSCASATALSREFGGRVCVADNHRISVTLRTSVKEAKRMAENGWTAETIKQNLEENAYCSSIYIAVNTLTYLRRGGRITPAAAMVGNVLQIKPVLTIQGEKLDSFAKVRGAMLKCESKMIEAVKNDVEKRFSQERTKKMCVGAAGSFLSESEKQNWLSMVQEAFPQADVWYDALSMSIACHTGPGAVGIGISFC